MKRKNILVKQMIPISSNLDQKEWLSFLKQWGTYIKDSVPSVEQMEGVIIVSDCEEGVRIAKQLGVPCLGVQLEDMPASAFLPCDYVVLSFDAIDEEYLDRIYRRFYGLRWDIATTNRLRIREMKLQDVPELLKLYLEVKETGMEVPFATEEAGETFVREYYDKVYRILEHGIWVLEQKDTGKLIGVAGLEYQVIENKEFLGLGYIIGQSWQRQGYATEACRAILEYGKEYLGAKKVYCFAKPENTASIHLAEKLGFRLKEEELGVKDYLVYTCNLGEKKIK